MSAEEPPERYDAVAVAVGSKLDEPRIAVSKNSGITVWPPWRRLESTQQVIFGQDNLIAGLKGDSWLVYEPPDHIVLP